MVIDRVVTARTLVQAGKRFQALGISSTAQTRCAYRELLVTAPGLQGAISGVILQDETFRQMTSTGLPVPQALMERGMLPGIKVDTGAKPLAKAPGEKVTEGLDGLRERIAQYVALGARFAKWRGVITIGDGMPIQACIAANAHALARFAELAEQGVALDAMVLKPSMILPGKEHATRATVDEVARRTLNGLRQTVPAAVPGIAFLSGGQSPNLATRHLQAINALGPQPWQLTFSFGRALQDEALSAWKGEAANVGHAQAALVNRTRAVAAARSGADDPVNAAPSGR